MLIWTCIVIIITGLVHASSASVVDQSNDDFRFVAYHDLLTTARRFSDHNVTSYSRLLFDVGRNALILGARNRIYRLSLHLDLKQRVEWEAPIDVIETCLAKGQNENDCQNYIMAIHENKDKLFICGSYAYSPKCQWRTIDSLGLIKEEASVGRSPFNPHSNITTLVTSDGKMFVGSTIDFSGSDSVILRTDLTSENTRSLRTKQYNDIELYDPQFVGSFEHGEYVYFVFREVSIEMASFGGTKSIYSRIARVCKNDAGGEHILKQNWISFYKARLNCSLPGGDFPFYFDEVQGISFLADDGELYATFTTPENSIRGSAICVFNMSAIEEAFSGPIKYQEVSGSPIWQTKQQEGSTSCGNSNRRSSTNLLDSSKYKLMSNAVQAMHSNPLYVEKLEVFTHISVTKVATKLHENVPVIFVTNAEGYVKKISILPRTKQSCLIEVLELEPENRNTKIESMEFVKASESLYIGTVKSLLQIPSQRCSRHISRMSCLNSMDPYCGWNDLTQKCSMPPNNDPLTSHWYQNATTCPILSTPVDGSFSAWSPWFKCAKSGEGDTITGNELSSSIDTCLCRTRTCDNPSPKNRGKPCSGHSIMVTNCTVNGGWSEWSSYGQCSQTCGVAIKVRRRTCSSPKAAFGGRTCVGVDRQEIYCTDLPPCPPPVPFSVDGNWGPFGDWSECSAPCGGGFKFRQRKCDDPAPMNQGIDCIGCNVEYEQCNKQPCNEVKKIGPFTPWLIVNNSDVGYLEKRFRYQCKAVLPDPSSLKITLFKEETRTCTNEGGCHRINEVSQKSATWGCWTDFSVCSVTCGIGRRVRYRKCIASTGEVVSDKECDGSSVQEEICEMPSCDLLNGWGEWSDWSSCNEDNEKTRYRQCKVLNASPKECIGNEREMRICNLSGTSSHQKIVMASSLGMHWIVPIFLSFGIFCSALAYFAAKYILERRINQQRRIQGSPSFITSYPNQYSSLPMKDFVDNKPKRQPSFSGSTSHSKLTNGHGTLNKSNNNLLHQNTPKILKYQNDTDTSTMKRNSTMNNNMRLKQIDDDLDKY